MKLKIKSIFSLIFLGISALGFAQKNDFSFKRAIKPNPATEWNKIEIPLPMYEKLNQNFSDIRIYQLSGKDSLEVPYLLSKTQFASLENETTEYIGFKILNQTKTADGYYFTLESPITADIEEIDLHFSNQNFDWKITLEGSHDQKQWFSILENYRILSIQNSKTDYNFQLLAFEKTNYKFYRIFIPSKETPILQRASMQEKFTPKIEFNKLLINNIKQTNSTKDKNSVITFSLPYKIPVYSLILNIEKNDAFSRPIEIKYLTDSVKTEKGWVKNYETFYYGKIIYYGAKDLDFSFSNNDVIWAKDFQIIIENQDNAPITVKSVNAVSPKYFIYFKPKNEENYFLFYGNKKSSLPEYDLKLIEDKVFKLSKSDASLSDEEKLPKKEKPTKEPLFKDKGWLWGVMILIICILGFFSHRMLSTKQEE